MTTTAAEAVASQDEDGSFAYRLADVRKTFATKRGEVHALDGVDLEIPKGTFVTIQGPTGGGKSTLLQMLGALDRPTSGSVMLHGTEISHASTGRLGQVRAHEIGLVFQSYNLVPVLTAAENVAMGLVPLGLSAAQSAERVAEALEQVGLSDRADHLPTELSGGQQQRVSIARAIAKRPQVLLADEPTGNLDESTRDGILDLLEHFNAEGLTLIVVTHDSAVAKRAHVRLRLAAGKVTTLED